MKKKKEIRRGRSKVHEEDRHNMLAFYKVFIFLTGAVTLSLELLASRIMVPYFGVSLYIWTGILSITLISLALGYFLGGKLATWSKMEESGKGNLDYLFLMMPAVSGISIGVACILYPKIFLPLAKTHLLIGSFAACWILLFFSLVTVSAMNPLLIAIQREKSGRNSKAGDAGSGQVYFISTVGSVIGVWVTAFVFIPNITNHRSTLFLGVMLSVLSTLGALYFRLENKKRTRLLVLAIIGLVLCGSLLLFSTYYLGKKDDIVFKGRTWKLEKEYSSLFGNTKILSVKGSVKKDEPEDMARTIYLQDGFFQSTVDGQGRSATAYTYVLEGLATTLNPNGRTALVMGMGAGIIPARLAKRGLRVDVVEINPNSITVAREYFGLKKDTNMTVHQTDARMFVKECARAYDMVFMDLFQGDGVPDYLLTRGFFRDLKRCVSPGGVVVMNTFSILGTIPYSVVKTLKSEFPGVLLFHESFGEENKNINIYLAALSRENNTVLDIKFEDVPLSMRESVSRVFSQTRTIEKDLLEEAPLLSDEYNTFSYTNAREYFEYRRLAIDEIPAPFLVN